jgi:hypothetical protein
MLRIKMSMTPSIPEGHISVIGTSYLHPITDLIESLEMIEMKGSNDLQTSYENGYAVAIIVLAVFLVESIVARIQVGHIDVTKSTKKPLDFIVSSYSSSDHVKKIQELFVVRDAIAHNHIWKAEFTNDTGGNMKRVGNSTLQPGYGDGKYRNVVDTSTQQTQLLKINVYPTRICYSDVLTVLKAAVAFLLFLENEDRNYIYLSNQRVTYHGQRILFIDLIQNL